MAGTLASLVCLQVYKTIHDPLWLLIAFLGFGGLSLVLWFGGREVIEGRLTGGQLISFLIYGISVAGSLGAMVGLYTSLQEALGATKRVFQLLDTPQDIQDAPNARAITHAEGRITFENVSFSYDERQEVLHDIDLEIAPGEMELALTPADVRRIVGAGKKAAVIGIENGYPIGTDITRVEEFYNRGGRYMSLAHNGHSQLADSNTGEASDDFPNKGLSELGRQVIAEMNRLGMMIDISHPSKQANLQAMALSTAPVIASHSSARAMGNHSRNLDDEQLMALKKNGGVVQTVAFASYINVTPPERAAEIAKLNTAFGLAPAGGRGQGGGRGAARGAGPSGLHRLVRGSDPRC